MDYQELIERLRYEGYDVSRNEAANAIESLLAENERLERNLSTTEQTMQEYQELAAKRLEEIAKYRDAPVVCWMVSGSSGMIAFQHHKPDQKDWYSIEPLIVKPGEEK